MRFRRKADGRKPELNLASMIDATFLLLAYFIFTSGAGVNESKLSPNLRVQQGTDAKDDLEPQVVEVLRRRADLTNGNDKRKAALEKIIKGRVSDLVFRFAMVLANHGRAGRIADVADAFDALLQERLGRIEVDMFTVDGKASDDVIATVKARVKEAFGKDAVLHQYTDPGMIGGLKIRIGDQLIDGSVATQLRSMRESVSTRGSTKIRSRVNDFLA